LGLSRRLFQGVFLTGGNNLRICVRFFALYRELIGLGEQEYTLNLGSKVEDLIKLIVEKHENMKDMKGMLVAINNAFVESDAELKNGDVVALLPPVSGG